LRNNLINVRKEYNLSIQDMCDYLNIKERMYRYIESGMRTGRTEIWDKLEELFDTPQKQLRENFSNTEKQAV